MSKGKIRSGFVAAIVLAFGVIVAVIFLPSDDCCAADAEQNVTGPQLISAAGYQQQFTGGDHILIDVRTPEEYATGHIADSVNIPLDVLGARMSEIPRNGPVVLYCRSGNRSATAINILDAAGYSDLYDLGGIIDWVTAGYPVQ